MELLINSDNYKNRYGDFIQSLNKYTKDQKFIRSFYSGGTSINPFYRNFWQSSYYSLYQLSGKDYWIGNKMIVFNNIPVAYYNSERTLYVEFGFFTGTNKKYLNNIKRHILSRINGEINIVYKENLDSLLFDIVFEFKGSTKKKEFEIGLNNIFNQYQETNGLSYFTDGKIGNGEIGVINESTNRPTFSERFDTLIRPRIEELDHSARQELGQEIHREILIAPRTTSILDTTQQTVDNYLRTRVEQHINEQLNLLESTRRENEIDIEVLNPRTEDSTVQYLMDSLISNGTLIPARSWFLHGSNGQPIVIVPNQDNIDPIPE